jgi:hypothetical protein
MRYSLLLAVAVSLGATDRASADTYLYHVYSLEALTDGSETVVVAKVVFERAAGGRKGTARIKEVERVLKGAAGKALPEVVNFSAVVTAAGESRAALFLAPADKPKALEVTYVVYLNKHDVPAKDRPAYFAGVLPQFHPSSGEPMAFTDSRCVAIDKGGKVLTDPDAVVKRIEARAKQHPKRVVDSGFFADIGDDVLLKEDVIYRVLTPFDPEFKKDFLKELGHKHGWNRYLAVSRLSHYKDQEVIAALKKCLADDFVGELPTESDPSKRKPYYAVRKVAYEALKAWDIDVPRPELDPPPGSEKKPE